MLKKPFLALCTDRTILAKENVASGAPEEWFSNAMIEQHGLRGTAFDFFINWNTRTVSNVVWVKRIVADNLDERIFGNNEIVKKAILECDGANFLLPLIGFCTKYHLRLEYILFKDNVDWRNAPAGIRKISFDEQANVQSNVVITLTRLKEEIQTHSGGPLRIGPKGLFYGMTKLECFLSNTDAPWPGDLDWMILEKDFTPKAILEYKKHTQTSPIQGQRLANYYPQPDGRKYNRLAMLRDLINPALPFVVVYYPTKPEVHSIKLEKVSGAAGGLRTQSELIMALPGNNDESKQKVIRALIGLF
jgi:hypothetical protein